MSRSLADLAAAFAAKNKPSNSNPDAHWKQFFPFWKAPVDSTTIFRFLRDGDESNPLDFLVENYTHELVVNGKRETVACLRMYDEECPICALSAHFYDKKSPDYNEDLGKRFYRKRSYIAQGLVVESPVEHDHEQLVKLVEFGPQIFKQIEAAFKRNDFDRYPYELKGGYNFRFEKTQTGQGQNSYTTSTFQGRPSDIADDVIEKIKLNNLSEKRTPKTDRAAIDALLTAALASMSGPAPAPAPAASQMAAAAPVQAPAAPAAPATGGSSLSDALRERIRRAQEQAE
jgi:hypothetical protein